MSKIYYRDQLVKHIIRKSLGLNVDDLDLASIVGTSNIPVMRRIVDDIASKIVVFKNNNLRCGICGRGPFTKRGLYLHLTRLHVNDILAMIDEEYAKYETI